MLCILGTIACWGAYVPTIHHGQIGFGDPKGPLRAFLFVGIAYVLVAIICPGAMILANAEPKIFPAQGMKLSLLAGVFGALGALGVIFALKSGGKPIYVAPLVFAGAPLVNVIVSMAWDRKWAMPDWRFVMGIVLAAIGTGMILRFKPA